jgi:hypothetical protein
MSEMMKYVVSYFQVHSQACGAPIKFTPYTWSNLWTAQHNFMKFDTGEL